jgi:hypothetical protein
MKKDFPNITIAGVNRKVFSIDLSGGGQEPFSLRLSFISKEESYDLNTRNPIQVSIGSFFNFTGYPVSFSKRTSVSSGETSELTLVDTSIILDKYWVGLKGKYGGGQPDLRKGTGPERRLKPSANYNVLNPVNQTTSDPNLNDLIVYETRGDFSDLILVGSYIDPCKDLASDTLTDMCDPCTAEQVANVDCAKSRNFEILDVDYTFSELIAEARSKNIKFYGNISAPTDYRAQYTGSLRSVLDSWCKDFGYGFYWENDGVNFVNLKVGINISNINLENTSNCKIEEFTISESIQDTKKIVNIAYFGKKGEIKNYQCSSDGGGSSDTTTTELAVGLNIEDLWEGNTTLQNWYKRSFQNFKRVVHASNITENIRNCIVWKYIYGIQGPSSIKAGKYGLMGWDVVAVLHASTNASQVKPGIDFAACRAAYNSYIKSQKDYFIPADDLGYYIVIVKQGENKFYEFEKEIVSKKFTGRYAFALTSNNEGKQFASEEGIVSTSIPDLSVNHPLIKNSQFEIIQDTQTKFKIIENVFTIETKVIKGKTPSLVCIEKEPSWTPSEDCLRNAQDVKIIVEIPREQFDIFFTGVIDDSYKFYRIASTSGTGSTNFTDIESDGNTITYKQRIELLTKYKTLDAKLHYFTINFPSTQSRRFQVTKTGNNFTPGPIISLIPKLEIVNANAQIRPNEDYVAVEVNHQNITDNNLSRITKGISSCYVDKGNIYEYGNSIIKNLNTSLPLKKITKTYSILGLPDTNFSFKDGLTSFSLRLDQSGTRTSLSFSNMLPVQISDTAKKNELNYLTKNQANVNYINNTFK